MMLILHLTFLDTILTFQHCRTREYLKDLLWLRSSFENRNPEPFAMVSIETWSFAMVSIRIATLIETLIETLVETSVSESCYGFDPKSQP